jgi:hypothetical protein
MENLPSISNATVSQCVSPYFCHQVLMQKSRAHSALIVHSKAVDPRCTTDMMVEEEKARECFKEMKRHISD